MNSPKPAFLIAIVLVLSVVSGCASIQLAPIEKDEEAKLFNPDLSKATVYIYRPFSLWGGGVTFPITFDGRNIGNLGHGEFYMLKVNPGKHDLWVSGADTITPLNLRLLLPIDAQKGKMYFIKQSLIIAASPTLEFVTEKEGKKAVVKCELLTEVEYKGPDLF